MVHDTELTIDEQRKVQLDILEDVDAFCVSKEIKYSLAFGTLLGAIRHKGYIPWDDDLDIMLPLDDYIRLRNEYKSDVFFFHDIETDKKYGNPFGNICSKNTYRKIGVHKGRGLGIDVYPIVRIPSSREEHDIFLNKAEKLQGQRTMVLRCNSFLNRKFNMSLPMAKLKCVRKYRDCLYSEDKRINNYNYFIICLPLSYHKYVTFDRDLFKNVIRVDFEGRSFCAIAEYDYFLKNRYGDYMQLPPEKDRQPYHSQHYYWK